jgi:hypothetical protein
MMTLRDAPEDRGFLPVEEEKGTVIVHTSLC